MATQINDPSNNPVKDRTPRQGNAWWIIVMVLLLAVGIFWALGRSDRNAGGTGNDAQPTGQAPPDQIDNTLRADGHPERVEQDLTGDRPAQEREQE